jgi:hypothetical protein
MILKELKISLILNKTSRRKQRGIKSAFQAAGFSTSLRPKERGIKPERD